MTWLESALREHSPRLLGRLRRWLGSITAAEDALQDVVVQVLAAGVTTPDKVQAYLTRAARNRALDHARDTVRRRQIPIDDVPEVLAGDADPERAAIHRAELRRLEAALATLPARQREVLLMHRLDGLSHEAIAHRLGCSPSTASVHLSRGLATLRRRLNVM